MFCDSSAPCQTCFTHWGICVPYWAGSKTTSPAPKRALAFDVFVIMIADIIKIGINFYTIEVGLDSDEMQLFKQLRQHSGNIFINTNQNIADHFNVSIDSITSRIYRLKVKLINLVKEQISADPAILNKLLSLKDNIPNIERVVSDLVNSLEQ